MKKIMAMVLALALTLGLAACGGKSDGDNLIGVAMPTRDLQRWVREGDDLKAGLENAGYQVEVQYAANDASVQISQIEDMLDAGCKVLVIAPVDGSALSPVLERAKAAKVPVIAYDRLIMDSDGVSYYVTFDDRAVGVSQGKYIAQALDLEHEAGPFNIEYVTGDPGNHNIHLLFNGALSVLQPYINEGKLITPSGQTEKAAATTPNWAAEAAESRFTEILTTYYSDGTQLDAVLAFNDSTALGVAKALEACYSGPYPILTGQDCESDAVKNILAGKQSMSVFKDTRILAARTVELVDAIMQGEEPAVDDEETFDNGMAVIPAILCQPATVTMENYAQQLIDSGYYTREALQ